MHSPQHGVLGAVCDCLYTRYSQHYCGLLHAAAAAVDTAGGAA